MPLPDKSNQRTRGVRKPFLSHLPPTAVKVRKEDISRAIRALRQPQTALNRFQHALGAWTGREQVYLTSSGRAALLVILRALQQGSQHKKVILPAYTCPTVAQAILAAGLTPQFCDVSPHTLGVDPRAVERFLDDGILAVISTHLYGLALDFAALAQRCKDHGVVLIEDAAQGFGASVGTTPAGALGEVAFTSMGRGKCIPTGHGGAIFASPDFAGKYQAAIQRQIASFIKPDLHSLLSFLGYALATNPHGWWFIQRSPLNPAGAGMRADRLPPVRIGPYSPTQAGIGLSIIERLPQIIAIHRRNATRWMEVFSGLDYVHFPAIPSHCHPSYLRFPLLVESKDLAERLFACLSKLGIGVSRSYTRTLPQIFSQEAGVDPRDYPGAQTLAERLLTLPTHEYLVEEHILRVKSMLETF